MSETLELRFELRKEDLTAALRSTPEARAVSALTWSCVAVTLLLLMVSPVAALSTMAVIALAAMCVGAAFVALTPELLIGYLGYPAPDAVTGAQQLEVGPEGLRLGDDAAAPWLALRGAVCLREAVLLYSAERLSCIPHHSLSEAELRDLFRLIDRMSSRPLAAHQRRLAFLLGVLVSSVVAVALHHG